MAPRARRSAILLALAGGIWIAGLVPWPGVLGYMEPAKPTLLAMAFALGAHRLGVASWPLVVTFSLTFFIYSFAMFYFSPDMRGIDQPVPGDHTRVTLSYFGAVLFSPITLWGPLLLGCGAYAVARRWWSNNRFERSRGASSVGQGGDR
jgi:NADH:ubiquinone oxidoreductase subunit 5 (subunit L)/multisubunit Na+/H+ antiporter MnhA subunit